MRVLVVTGTAPHHKNLCVKLVQAHQVVGIINPNESAGARTLLQKLRYHARRNELPLALLHGLRKAFRAAGLWSGTGDNHTNTWDFRSAEEDYLRLPQSLIHSSCDVEASETHALLRELQPDVTVCLGGPIYPKTFLECSPLTLNFHSGISPIYNGAASIDFAFANGHPHLCGGTLMVMGTGVDDGGMLGHYFPAIEHGDAPETLFQKTVAGAVGMYDRLLKSLSEHPRQLTPIPQPRPIFYTRSIELGWHQYVMTARHQRQNLVDRFRRPERIVEYWRAPSLSVALQTYRETIDSLLWGTSNAASPGVS